MPTPDPPTFQEDPRAAAARTIKPGWAPVALTSWYPHKHKPQLNHLITEAQRRLPGLRCKNWTAPKLVEWLTANADDGTASYSRGDISSTPAHLDIPTGAGTPLVLAKSPLKPKAKRGAEFEASCIVADERAEAAAKRRKAEVDAESAKDELIDSKMAALEKVEAKLNATVDGSATLMDFYQQRKDGLEAELKLLLGPAPIAKSTREEASVNIDVSRAAI